MIFIKKICITLVFLLSFTNSASAYDVVFNIKSLIYHAPTCEWARKCTKNCIRIDHTKALSRGGKPCNACGGLESSSNKLLLPNYVSVYETLSTARCCVFENCK